MLCFGDWSRKDLVVMADVVAAIREKRGKRKRLDKDTDDDDEVVL
jgi:hypothetical protein